MAMGRPGADSSVPVTTEINGQNLIELATGYFKEPPVFWGRYFTSVSTSGTVEYRHSDENEALRSANIHLLPIARQSENVNGTEAAGAADAQANVADLIATFGANYLAGLSRSFYMFLDVEENPSLSASYYTGWARTLASYSLSQTGGRLQILPCVYATQSAQTTWSVLASAVDAGTPCHGAWIAAWPISGGAPLPDWKEPTPSVAIPFPVLIWQYSDNCYGPNGFDCSETNPTIDLQADLLDYLILPPASSTTGT